MKKYSIILLILIILISIAQRYYVDEKKYTECEDEMNSQSGYIAVLPASCSKFAERLFSNQK